MRWINILKAVSYTHLREELLEERDNIVKNDNKGNNGIVQIKADIKASLRRYHE